MRILMLTQSYAPIVGGVERVVEDLSSELRRRGHEVGVATLRQPAEPSERTDDGATVHPLGSATYRLPGVRLDKERRHAPPLPDPETALQLRRLIRRERPDVVHAHNWLIHSYLPLDRRSGPALALSMHDYGLICATKRFFHEGAPCSGPGMTKCIRCAGGFYGSSAMGFGIAVSTRLSERHVRRHVDVLLPVSTAVRDLCRVGEDELHRVIPNFIRSLPPAPADAEARLAALPREPFILYFGDVTVDKGADLLVKAYRSLEGPPPLVMIGRCFLPEVNQVPGVMALGAMPHPYAMEALRRSLLTVVPSILPEAFGLAALETAAAGKPIVASDIGGLRDVVADGETGLLVAPGDQEAMRAALQRLLSDAELRKRMGAAARVHAADFGPDAVVPRFEEAYEAALQARRARRR
jgi:glycosyltransferase involved in cell wall biosynthesis